MREISPLPSVGRNDKKLVKMINFVEIFSVFFVMAAIIAMPSTTRKGINKIVPALDLGSGAVTTRNHIHWFITEYGAVNLYGRSLQERAKLIISVAHPKYQEELDEAAFKRFGPHYHYICRNNLI